jgi:hypothetical protein
MTALNVGLFLNLVSSLISKSTVVFVVLFEIFRLKAFLAIHYF